MAPLRIGDRLSFLLTERKKTAVDLAKYMGENASAVRNWLCNLANPSFEKLAKVAAYFGVTTDYLLKLSDDPFPALDISELANQSGYRISPADLVRLPISSHVRAGYGDPLEEGIMEDEYIPRMPTERGLVRAKNEYWWYDVQGNSMIEAGIEPGDRVLVHDQDDLDNGDLGVIITFDDFSQPSLTLKWVRFTRNSITLVPANPEYEAQVYANDKRELVKIVGKVIQIAKEPPHLRSIS